MRDDAVITSRSNPNLVRARRVRDGREPGSIFLEGLRLVEEAARSRLRPHEVFYTERIGSTERGAAVIERLTRDGTRAYRVSEKIFDSICETRGPQGIVLIAERPPASLINPRPGSAPCLYLMEVSDPSNLGAILRTAEATDAAGVITSPGSADVFSAKALRAGMGANLRVPVQEGVGLEEVFRMARERGWRTIATDVSAVRAARYTAIDWSRPSLLMLGSEAHGLGPDVTERCDDICFIPMENRVESLNLAVAAAVILFEARRQAGHSGQGFSH